MKWSFSFPLLLAAGLAVEGAQADALAVDVGDFDGATTPTAENTYGYQFSVSASYTITALGVFDNIAGTDGPGLRDEHPVGLWDSTGALIASVTVPAGLAAPLEVGSAAFNASGDSVGVYRMVPLPAGVALTPGENYVIGAYYPTRTTPGDTFLNDSDAGDIIKLSGITVIQNRLWNTLVSGPYPGGLVEPPDTFGTRLVQLGPSFLVESAIVTPDLAITISGQSTDTNPVTEGPAGVFSFTATFCNKAASPTLESLISQTVELTNGNSLVNRDRDGTGTPPGGAGSELDFPLNSGYTDGVLDPNECVDVPYEIGLDQFARFNFFVDVLGVEASAP